MSAAALALVIFGALAHATWNLVAKRVSGGAPFVFLYGLVSLAITVPLATGAWLLDPRPIEPAVLAAAALSGALHLAYSLVLQRGYQAADFSIVYPVARGSGPLIAVGGAILLLAESPSGFGWLGIAAILAGVVVIALQHGHREGPVARGVAWGMLTGAFIGAYTLVDGWAMKTLGASPLVFYAVGFGFRILLMTPAVLREREAIVQRWRSDAGRIVIVGALVPLAYILILFAMKLAPLSYVAPAREISMLLGAWLGARFLGEAHLGRRMAGTAIMVAGVVILGLA